MTYDQWKTTDPNDRDADEEIEPTELELAYEQLQEARDSANFAAERAASRIKELESALEEALEYFKDRYDVVDGSYGEPAPNREMSLGQMIDITLHGIQF